MKQRYKYILIIGGAAVAATSIVWTAPHFSAQPTIITPSVTVASLPLPSTARATLVIFDGTSALFDAAVPIYATSTVFGMLQSATASSGIAFAYRTYPGMGYLVTKIGNRTNGIGGAYWQYWINGVYAQESADHAPVHAGDTVNWKFIAPQK
jgi:hypothetical protein